MADENYIKYTKALSLRKVEPQNDAALLIRFGRDLYRESLGNEDAFFRDYGRYGANFPVWISACMERDRAYAKFLVEDGEEVALAVLGIDEHDRMIGRVHHFYVTPTHRGQGFGGILDDYARDTLSDRGCCVARLNVSARNKRAIRFYEGLGWLETHRRGGLIWMETKL